MRFVSACTRRTSASCSRVALPGWPSMKALPWRMTSRPSGARSLGMEALTTSLTSGSSRISRSLRARFARGYRWANAAARSGSLAKKETSSPPPRITESTWPLMWPWFKPIAANRMRAGFGGGALSCAETLPERTAAHATPAVVIDDLRNARRPVRSFFIDLPPHPECCWDRGRRLAPARRLQVLQQLRIGGQDQPRLLVQAGVERLHRLEELVEVRITAIGAGVDRGRLRVRGALDLLGRLVPGGAGREHVALLLAANLRRPPLAFGPAALRDALALRNHALEDLLLDGVDVVDALEAHVHQLDAELGRDPGGLLQDDLGDLAPPHGHRGHGLRGPDARQLLRQLEGTVARTDHLDQVEGGDRVSRLAVHVVVEPALASALVAHVLEEAQGIGDAPAGVGVHPDVLLVFGGDLVGIAVVLQPALVEPMHGLDERHLGVQARLLEDAAERPSELREDDLLGLGDGIDGGEEQQRDGGHERDERAAHRFTSAGDPSSCSSGKMPRAFSSSISLRPARGMRVPIGSR